MLRYGNLTIVSSSPERFWKLAGRQVETRTIKGTIARSSDLREDQRRGRLLLASEKDRAESIMIVDLMRNDLSRICAMNWVEVRVLCESNPMLPYTTSYPSLPANLPRKKTPSPCCAPAFLAAR